VVRVLFYPEHFSPTTEVTAKKSLEKARKFRGSAAATARWITSMERENYGRRNRWDGTWIIGFSGVAGGVGNGEGERGGGRLLLNQVGPRWGSRQTGGCFCEIRFR
jgi:hypothetical protein